MIIFLIALFSAILIYSLVRLIIPIPEKELVKGRISRYFKATNNKDIEEQVIKERYEKLLKRKSKGKKFVSRELSEYILRSGLKLTPAEFLYGWAAIVVLPVLFLSIIKASTFTVIAIFILTLVIPPILIQRQINKRRELFTKQLGDALVIIGNALKAGFSFIQALETIVTDMQPPISYEFEKTLREINYGLSQEEALLNMSDRIKDRDLELLVSSVITSSQVGGSLSEVLETISDTIRDRIRIKQEVKVLTASGRISSLIIGALPIFLLLILMVINPSYVSMFFDTVLGKIMLVVAFILEAIGFLFIRKLTDLKY